MIYEAFKILVEAIFCLVIILGIVAIQARSHRR